MDDVYKLDAITDSKLVKPKCPKAAGTYTDASY